MSPKKRFYLYLGFVAVFLITAPVLVLYTAGYRLNVKTGQVLETGVVSIESTPKNTSVLINGVIESSKTPTILDNVAEGEHTIRLEKDGFIPWEKRVDVRARQTTFIRTAHLFADAPPEVAASPLPITDQESPLPDPALVMHNTPTYSVLSRKNNSAHSIIAYLPLGDYTIEADAPHILLVDKRNGRLVVIDEFAPEPIQLIDHATQWVFSPSKNHLLYTDGFDLQVHNSHTRETTTVTRVSRPIVGIAWDPSETIVFYAQSEQVFAAEIQSEHNLRLITPLATGTAIETLTIDRAGEHLFFFDTREGVRILLAKPLTN